MAEYVYELKIPKDRVAVLIGKNGEVKKRLESTAEVKIDVDSEEGDCLLKGEDALALFTMLEVVRAIGRGFNPDTAMQLFKQDYVLDVISLGEFSKNGLARARGRVIGEKGKCRETIETLTDSQISVYGKTICIIGRAEKVTLARRAIENLLKGNSHASVYSWLERQRKKFGHEFLRG